MRTAASYALFANNEKVAERIEDAAWAWLNRKGCPKDRLRGEYGFRLIGGRAAELFVEQKECEAGRLLVWELREQVDATAFTTKILVAATPGACTFSCALIVGSAEGVVAPMEMEVRCPRLVRDVLQLPVEWWVGATRAWPGPRRLVGRSGGLNLAGEIRDPERGLPLIVVSELEGFLLHPKIAVDLAHDTAGVANVVTMDDSAARTLTRELGGIWSCYNGAIRIYWPNAAAEADPFAHHLWTATRLLSEAGTVEDAARRIRTQLRRKLLGIASYSLREPAVFEELRTFLRRDEREAWLKGARANQGWEETANLLMQDNDRLEAERKRLMQEIERLEKDVKTERYLRMSMVGRDLGGDVAPVTEKPPETVIEAVELAKERYEGDLSFGPDVDDGVLGLADSAGPPDKIFEWLGILAEVAREKRANRLGKGIVQWLEERGVRASPESETTRNSRDEQRRRTWSDGTGMRVFDLHIKPKEGTSPDRCPRIYFDWDESRQLFVIGWVGRHP